MTAVTTQSNKIVWNEVKDQHYQNHLTEKYKWPFWPTQYTTWAEKNPRSDLVHPFILWKLCLIFVTNMMFLSVLVLKRSNWHLQSLSTSINYKQNNYKVNLKIHVVVIISKVTEEVSHVPVETVMRRLCDLRSVPSLLRAATDSLGSDRKVTKERMFTVRSKKISPFTCGLQPGFQVSCLCYWIIMQAFAGICRQRGACVGGGCDAEMRKASPTQLSLSQCAPPS